MTTTLGFRKQLQESYDEALPHVTEALKAEGFGVLTNIDIQGTLKEKAGVDFRRYTILGACNPAYAHQALQADLEVGLLLPCNVVVYEGDDKRAVVLAVDPERTMAATGNAKLEELAGRVRENLERVLAHLD